MKEDDALKVLVTGADGMLGSYTVHELLERGYAVRALVQPGSESPTLDDLPVERFPGDLLDAEAMRKAVAGCRRVIHSAAVTDLRGNADRIWKINLDGTRHVMDAAEAAGVERVVFVGSASSFQFGTRENPPEECGEFPPEYRGVAYMESKRQAALMVRERVRRGRLNAVVAAPTFLVGGYNFRPGSSALVRGFMLGKLRVASPGGRNFAYAGDVAHGLVNALEQGRAGEFFFLGGENLTYAEFLGKIARVAGRPEPWFTLPEVAVRAVGLGASCFETLTGKQVELNNLIARMSVLSAYYSSAKAIRELDLPQTPIETAIDESIAGLRKYGHLT